MSQTDLPWALGHNGANGSALPCPLLPGQLGQMASVNGDSSHWRAFAPRELGSAWFLSATLAPNCSPLHMLPPEPLHLLAISHSPSHSLFAAVLTPPCPSLANSNYSFPSLDSFPSLGITVSRKSSLLTSSPHSSHKALCCGRCTWPSPIPPHLTHHHCWLFFLFSFEL